ncbi:CLUMA_CG008858, isoform A [Clunio marinus]|uniref:CLUMA_CG008858, isoform A n=1 Tax=Clunio marinus TaxID=568069 RepID=A0A1J1I9W1_9DIPT|nr:CLUMA_CG008858, isoform A [Clunio marinus]
MEASADFMLNNIDDAKIVFQHLRIVLRNSEIRLLLMSFRNHTSSDSPQALCKVFTKTTLEASKAIEGRKECGAADKITMQCSYKYHPMRMFHTNKTPYSQTTV